MCLFSCAYTLGTLNKYQEQCNAHWQQEIERMNCLNDITNPQDWSPDFSIAGYEIPQIKPMVDLNNTTP